VEVQICLFNLVLFSLDLVGFYSREITKGMV
jgi:hypothetical protein